MDKLVLSCMILSSTWKGDRSARCMGTLNDKSWRPRPIVVEFYCKETIDLVFRARYNIKTNPNYQKFWMNERLDEEQKTQRMELDKVHKNIHCGKS